MSDLFKDHGPKLSDDEDRRLWQRVRAIPGEAAPVRAPWWQVLWTMPAVRYGAPAFAVLLVAVVWVAERRPEPPARVAAEKAAIPAAEAPAPANTNAPLPMAQAPTATRTPETNDARGLRELSKDQAADRADGGAVVEREVTLQAAPQAKAAPPPAPPAAVQATRKAAKFAAEPGASGAPAASSAPAAPARDELALKSAPSKESAKNEAAPKAALAPTGSSSWGVGMAARDGAAAAPPRAIDHAAGDRLAVGTLPSAAELARHAILSDVLDPAHGGDLHAWVRLPEDAAWAPAGWREDWTVSVVSGESGATAMDGEIHEAGNRPVDYDDAPPRVQVAVLAHLLERALVTPGHGRLEALRRAALAIDPAAGGYGRSRLLTLLAGALGAAPAR